MTSCVTLAVCDEVMLLSLVHFWQVLLSFLQLPLLLQQYFLTAPIALYAHIGSPYSAVFIRLSAQPRISAHLE